MTITYRDTKGSALTHDEMDENLRDLHYFTPSQDDAVTTRTKNTKLSECPSVMDFGATGNGVTDDTDAFTEARDAVAAAGGGVVYVPEGIYAVDPILLSSYVTFCGPRRSPMETGSITKGAVILQRGTTGDVFYTSDYSTLTYGAGVSDLTILGNSSATAGRGVYLSSGTWWCHVTRCNIRRHADQGVRSAGVANTIRDNFIGYNTLNDYASFTFYKGQLEVFGTDPFVVGNEVHGISDPGTFDGAALSNASLYACAILVQSASGFYHRNIGEIADAGIVVISRHSSKTGGSGKADPYYPASCHSNTFLMNRADYNLGHGFWVVTTDSLDGPYDNNFVANWVNACGRNANNTYDGFKIQKSGSNYPLRNTFTANRVFENAGSSNKLKYGFNSDALSSQSVEQRDGFNANQVDSASIVTNRYNGVASDDFYEEGVFTPELTFATAGDLSVAYAANGQVGRYTINGNVCRFSLFVNASTFTHTTASGEFRITGLPIGSRSSTTNLLQTSSCSMQGWTKANYTNTVAYTAGTSYLVIEATGSAQTRAVLAAGDLPTGSAKVLTISGEYEIARAA
jgi:hypothetical protein